MTGPRNHVAVYLTVSEWARVYRRLVGDISRQEWNGDQSPITTTIGEAGRIFYNPARLPQEPTE